MAFLARRHRQPEIMDEPGLDAGLHEQALKGLARINFWSASAGILWPAIAELARSGPVRLLDVASGAGDVPIRLWQRARRAGVSLEAAACDVSPTAIAHAEARARSEQ